MAHGLEMTFDLVEKTMASHNNVICHDVSRRICPHCNKSVSFKTYKAHRRLFYDWANDVWQTLNKEENGDDPSLLKDPLLDGEHKECYIGRGLFGVVRLQEFRGITVAVKEFLPRTVCEDVTNEAHILTSLCHPYLPLLFGVCLKEEPYRLVMQFHETDGKSVTLFQELRVKKADYGDFSERIFAFCAQLVEAVHYLHHEVEILHNDISTTNIVLDNNHIVLIDFGKATKISEAKLYQLSESEKLEYMAKYPHMAPEVIYGRQRQSIYSDIYAVGLVFYHVCDHSSISQEMRKSLKSLAEKCRSVNVFTRPKSSDILKYLQNSMI